jgi:hypothetical protein
MYLSYSGYKTYRDCPMAYWHKYVNRTVPVEPDNCVNSLYGSVVGALFESFYKGQLWRNFGKTEAALIERVPSMLDEVIRDATSHRQRFGQPSVLLWKGPKRDGKDPRANYRSTEELTEDIKQGVSNGLLTIKSQYLLGEGAQAEVSLDSVVRGHDLAGRSDFLVRRSYHRDLVILDGKGSKFREAFTDTTQLKWYGMLHRLRHKTYPDRLGFVYWRYKPPDSLDWVPFTRDDLAELLEEVLKTVPRIEHAQKFLYGSEFVGPDGPSMSVQLAFPPTGSKKDPLPCRFCLALPSCPDGRAAVEALEAQKRSRRKILAGVEED